MTVLYIALAVLAIIFIGGGVFLFRLTSVRRPVDDMWDEALVKKNNYESLWDDIRRGRDWMNARGSTELELMSFDGKKLRGVLIPREDARGTIIFFHGWRSSWKLDFSAKLEYFNSLGLNIIMVDERAHGLSEGRYICFGAQERHDVLSWATYAAQLFGEEQPVFLSGVSMGSSAVLMAASFDFPAGVRGIIADCGFVRPYDIMECVMKKIGRFFPYKAALWLLNIFTHLFAGYGLRDCSTTQALESTRLPVLFIHGTADSFVPWEMSQRGYDACAGEKELILVDGADHALSWYVDPQRYKAAVEAFINRHLG